MDPEDWVGLAQLIEAAGLGKRDPNLTERIFKGSYALCFAYEEARLIGTARAISDGVNSSVIYDVVVHPDYQGLGVGKRIMQDLVSRLPERSVMLVSSVDRCGFYRKLGFRRLKTAMLKHQNEQFWIENGYVE
jgi:ribosomal protein S18 acetylase RimI-like enzyme